jgi:hypothetical protein
MCQECNEKREKVIQAIISGDGPTFQAAERELWEHTCVHLGIDPTPQQDALFEMEAG